MTDQFSETLGRNLLENKRFKVYGFEKCLFGKARIKKFLRNTKVIKKMQGI